MSVLKFLMYSAFWTASVFYFIVQTSFNYWKYRGILHKPPHRFFGHLKGAGRAYHLSDILQQHYQSYSEQAPFIGFYMGLKPMILVLDIDVVNCILKKDAEHFTNEHYFHIVHNNAVPKQIVNDNDKLMQLCRILNYNMMSSLNQIPKSLEHYLQENIKVNKIITINDIIEDLNIETVSSLVFGLSNGEDKIQFNTRAKHYIKYNINIYKSHYNIAYPSVTNAVQVILQSLLKIYNNSTKYYLEINDKYTKPSKENSSTNVKGLLYEGTFTYFLWILDVLNSIFVCCLYELSKNPEIQNRARNEIQKILERNNHQIKMKTLHEFIYLKQIINETLRKCSPYPFLLRVTTKDYEIPRTVFMFKKDNHLIIPIKSIHHDYKYYENPLKFDPEHFNETQIQTRPLSAFLPFGYGDKSCIAQQLISSCMLIGLVVLLKDFQYELYKENPDVLHCDKNVLFFKLKSKIKLVAKKI